MNQITLYKCQFCDEEIRYKKALQEHETNHSPRWKKDGTIHISGGDIVILLSRSEYHSWDYYHKSHSKNTHISFIDGGKRLEQWEKDNGIEFVMGCKGVDYFRIVNETLHSQSNMRNINLKQSCKYTKGILGQARLISCEYEKHGSQCQHGDCTCKCHKEKQN